MGACLIGAVAITTQASPQDDLQQFRSYFKERFPEVPMDEYSNGLYAFPAAGDRRAEWEQIEEFPPYEIDISQGEQFWKANGLGSCMTHPATNYPRWDAATKQIVTAEQDINACLKKLGKEPIKDLKKGTMAHVMAHYRNQYRGQRVKLDYPFNDPDALAAYEMGKTYFWAKRGQLNFSCANCHVHSAGKFIGGNILSAALGHTTNFPVYRNKWGGLGTLHRRYGGCNKQVRAKPLKAQSAEYRALELYETYMATDLPLTAPGNRG
jgi:sulfur-oxidizing protein SoxA